MPSIANHSTLIIGGTSGIGFAVAHLLLTTQSPSHIAIASSNPSRVAHAVQRLKSALPPASGGAASTTTTSTTKITGHVSDLSSSTHAESTLETLLNDVTDNGKHLLDHIVYTAVSAGNVMPKPVTAVTVEEVRSAGEMGLTVPLVLAKHAPAYLNAAPETASSSITFTSGRVAQRPVPGWTVGAAYGSALIGMTQALALEYGAHEKRIRVNIVSPGATNTELWGDEENRKAMREMIKGTQLLGKVGTPEEVAEAYVYLMRDWNSTGVVVSSSGGALLK